MPPDPASATSSRCCHFCLRHEEMNETGDITWSLLTGFRLSIGHVLMDCKTSLAHEGLLTHLRAKTFSFSLRPSPSATANEKKAHFPLSRVSGGGGRGVRWSWPRAAEPLALPLRWVRCHADSLPACSQPSAVVQWSRCFLPGEKSRDLL